MPKNKIEDLRNMLFETMEKLLDPDDPMDLDRAETVGKVAQVVINSAKVEVDFMRQTGFGGSQFLQGTNRETPLELVAGSNAKPAFKFGPETRQEDLCQNCTLPDCDDTSPRCLVQIQRKAA
jgi:hypothetical protein